MRPLFTVHAGEFIVGEFIERAFPMLNVWVPAKDTGVDLLVTGGPDQRPISIQVKLSRDYKAFEATNDFERNVIAAGWLTIKREKLEKSQADWWVVLIVSHERKMKPQYLVIQPQELLNRMTAIHGRSKGYHFYPVVTKNGVCLDSRGLTRTEKGKIMDGKLNLGARDLSACLGNWSALEKLAAAT